ncbi:hypothetical protein LINPERHAP1_LOCUS13480 [Linum perenne]
MNAASQVVDGRAGRILRILCSSPIVSEARAILEAVKFASTSQSICTIFTDSLVISTSIKKEKHQWPWEYFGLIGNIVDLLSTFPTISVHFIPRKENAYADWIARSARQDRLPQGWLQCLLHTRAPPGGPL